MCSRVAVIWGGGGGGGAHIFGLSCPSSVPTSPENFAQQGSVLVQSSRPNPTPILLKFARILTMDFFFWGGGDAGLQGLWQTFQMFNPFSMWHSNSFALTITVLGNRTESITDESWRQTFLKANGIVLVHGENDNLYFCFVTAYIL